MTYGPVDHVALADDRLLQQFKIGDPPTLAPPAPAQPTGPQVTRDGPGSVLVPQSTADFIALGLRVPDHLWLCQESSGNLVPTIGSVQLAPNASPLYQQTVAGWSRRFVGTAVGTAGQRFFTADAALDLAAGESMAWIIYASLANSGAVTRRFLAAQGDQNGLRVSNTNSVLTIHNNVMATLAGAYNDLAAVHPFVWRRDGAADASGATTDLESVAGTHSELAQVGVQRCIGAPGAQMPPDLRVCWSALYMRANAQGIDWAAYLNTLGW